MSAPASVPVAAVDQALTIRDHELMAKIPLKSTAFYKRKARGEFRFLEIAPQLKDGPTLYSRVKVERWLNGELQQPEAFVRFFPRARRPQQARRAPGRPRKGNQSAAPLQFVNHAAESEGGQR